MKESMVHLTARVPAELLAALDDLARQRRKQTGGEVRRADLVREALERMIQPGSDQALLDPRPGRLKYEPAQLPAPSLLDQSTNFPDERESVRLALEIIAQLANDAAQRGLLTGPPQDLGMAVWAACDQRQDLELLTDFASKLYGALRAV